MAASPEVNGIDINHDVAIGRKEDVKEIDRRIAMGKRQPEFLSDREGPYWGSRGDFAIFVSEPFESPRIEGIDDAWDTTIAVQGLQSRINGGKIGWAALTTVTSKDRDDSNGGFLSRHSIAKYSSFMKR